MTEVKLPRISEDHDESSIVFWNKQEGDPVSKGDPLVEVQTEKIVTELAAETDGVLEQILVERGDVASAGDVLAVISTQKEERAMVESETAATVSAKDTMENKGSNKAFMRIAPRLRRLAGKMKVDLTTITGTGTNGTITEKDIKNAAEGSTVQENTGETLKGVRKTIADRMKCSLQNSAQLTETAYADVTAFAKKRKESTEGLSWNAWVLYATILALKEHNYMNGTFEQGIWKQSEEIQLGIAVNTDDGLLVPVVKNASQYSITKLTDEVSRLAKLAHSRQLSSEELNVGTFTVTNLGGFGIQFFTPILNPPEIGILGVGQVESYLVKGNDEIKERKRLPLSLTFDHQIVDGAPAARFLQTLIAYLGKSDELL